MLSQGRPSSAPRPASRAPTPASESPLNRDGSNSESSSAGGKKGAASSLPAGLPAAEQHNGSPSLSPSSEDLLEPTIVLKPHPSDLRIKPRILQPLMLLPRERLSLSALDLSCPNGDFPASRFYESRIKILDLEQRLGSNVLLARSGLTQCVYAIERERDGLYVLCKVGAWVDVFSLGRLATVVSARRLKSRPTTANTPTAAFSVTTLQLHHESKKRLAIEEIHSAVSNKRARSMSVARSEQQIPTPIHTDSAAQASSDERIKSPRLLEEQPRDSYPDITHTNPNLGNEEPSSQPTADDIFQNIRTQYFEALYHSMGSLAYFAKGPLSRARAAFHLDVDSNLDMNDLIDFLKSLVMTTVLIDKKYRDTVPEILSSFKALVQDSENDEQKPKKRKAKKMRLGKDGLYPGEPDHIRRWWTSRQPAASEDEEKVMSQQKAAYHVACARRRETLLQMIIILEILALEPLSRPADSTESQLPGAETQDTPKEQTPEPVKKRSKHNFPVLLDVHADRLCIWNSTMLDEVKALAESQLTGQEPGAEKSSSMSSHSLPDFCRDVILPFFSARLPEICDSINRKLGGPVKAVAPMAKPPKPAAPLKGKPGAPAKRKPVSSRDKDRALERALSKDKERLRRSVSRGPDAFALMKSASTVTIPGLKREASDPLMAMIPKADRNVPKEKQPALFSRSHSFTNATDLKAKRKAEVEAELKDAISALKKPNRALAGKEIIEEAEKRKTVGVTQLKKLKKGTRWAATQGVVKATPANNRFRDAIGVSEHESEMMIIPEDEHVPSSSAVVPSSTVPRKVADLLNVRTSAARSVADNVQVTPAKTPSAAAPSVPAFERFPLLSSPIMARKAAPSGNRQPNFFGAANLKRGKENRDFFNLPSSPALPALFETPMKPRSAMGSVKQMALETPIKTKGPALAGNPGRPADASPENNEQSEHAKIEAPVAAAPSIFQRLGWDADELDDLA